MKYLQKMLFLLAVLALLVGCGAYPETTHTVKVAESKTDANTRILTITSSNFRFDAKEKEVRPKLEKAVNSGQYNIITVKTAYTNGYLTSADITYDSSGPDAGNNTRILLIKSDKYRYDAQQKEVEPKLREITGSGKYNIIGIETVYVQGYLVAAEVYYKAKE